MYICSVSIAFYSSDTKILGGIIILSVYPSPTRSGWDRWQSQTISQQPPTEPDHRRLPTPSLTDDTTEASAYMNADVD